jgi:hypothetical protein
MDKTKSTAGKSTAKPLDPIKPNEQIEKALLEIEELKKQLDARNEALDKREKELDARSDELKKTPIHNTTPQEEEAYKTKAQKMKEFLWKQPKITIMIPLELGEKDGAYLPVTLNGYRLNIRKNTYVEVPKPIADLLREILKQNEAAGYDFRTDVPRAPKDGVSIQEALM